MPANLIHVALPALIAGLIIHKLYGAVFRKRNYTGITLTESIIILIGSIPGFAGCAAGFVGFMFPLPLLIGFPLKIISLFTSYCGWYFALNVDFFYIESILDSYFFAWMFTCLLLIIILYLIKFKKITVSRGFFIYFFVFLYLVVLRFYVPEWGFKKIKNQNIKEDIVGKWKKTKIIKLGNELKSERSYLFFKSNGEMPSYEPASYTINGNNLTMVTGKERTYKVLSLSNNELVMKATFTPITEIYVYERDDLKINAKWIANKILINDGDWGAMHQAWFPQLIPTEKYEMKSCEFNYFHENGEYSRVYTQACYREKGTDTIHIDLNNKTLNVYVSFGAWWIDSNVIYTKSMGVKGDPEYPLGNNEIKEFYTRADNPNSIPGFLSLTLYQVPEYSSIHIEAKEFAKMISNDTSKQN